MSLCSLIFFNLFRINKNNKSPLKQIQFWYISILVYVQIYMHIFISNELFLFSKFFQFHYVKVNSHDYSTLYRKAVPLQLQTTKLFFTLSKQIAKGLAIPSNFLSTVLQRFPSDDITTTRLLNIQIYINSYTTWIYNYSYILEFPQFITIYLVAADCIGFIICMIYVVSRRYSIRVVKKPFLFS